MTTSRTSRRWTIAGTTAIVTLSLVAMMPSAPASAGSHDQASTLLTTKTVTNTNPSGPGSLRAAFFKVNNPALAWDTIEFNIAGGGRQVISPASNLPALTAPVTIDGYSQPGASQADDVNTADLKIVIDATGLSRGLRITTDDSLVTGLVIRDADTGVGDGIDIVGDGNTIAGCYVGVAAPGEGAAGNTGFGVSVTGDSNLIGGTLPADRNLISANGDAGVVLSGAHNVVDGNRIGTDDDGESDLGNALGVEVVAGNGNTVGASAANLVSANDGDGVSVEGGANTVVFGNLIGTEASGTAALGNNGSGVFVDVAGTNVSDNVIGANLRRGIDIRADESLVFGNEIGVSSASGPLSILPNGQDGIFVNADKATIGDTDAGNTIGANLGNGVRLVGDDHVVSSNFIGIDSTGTLGLGNGMDGVLLEGRRSVIGGASSTLGNVVSDNGRHGIEVIGQGGGGGHAGNGTGDLVELNLVGTDPTGLLPVPNTLNGIEIEANFVQVITNTAAFNLVNGIEVAASGVVIMTNVVFLNGAAGIEIFNGTDNPMVGNSVSDNGALGIDLFPLGVTPNDAGDPDAGANDLLNSPGMMSAVSNMGGTLVSWRVIQGLPSTVMQLEFFASAVCDGSGRGEAATPLGTTVVATDAAGNVMGNTQLTGSSVPGQVVTATATVVPVTTGPTSELSNCVTVS